MRKTLGIVAACGALSLVVGCGTEPPPFSPQALELIQKENARSTPPVGLRPLSKTLPVIGPAEARSLRPTTQPVNPVVRMKLQELVHRAVVNNLDARVAAFEASIDELRIMEAIANFDPTIFAQGSISRQFPQGITPSNLNPSELEQQQIQAGVRQRLTSGGQAELRFQTTRSRFDSQPFIFNPLTETQTVYDNQLVFQITQPLLQNFGAEVNRARITIARNDFKITWLDWRNQVEKTIQQLEEAYWRLLLAQRDVEIEERLLADTERTLRIIIDRGQLDVSRLQISQVRASYEQRAALLVRSRSRIEDLSDQIKRLLNDPDLPVGSSVTILPADVPLEEPVRFNLADLIETGLQNRLELIQQSLRIDSARTIVKAAKNNLLPQLNFVGSAGLEGLGNDFRSALEEAADPQLFSYSAGLQFEVPIGNRLARAIYQRTLLQHQQAIDQYRLTADQVALDVKQALREVVTNWNEIEASRLARFAAEDALTAIEQRERAGEALTPTFVQLKLDRQASLAETQRQENQAIAGYNAAISTLERAKGTLLRYNNVVLKEEQGPWALPGGRGKVE